MTPATFAFRWRTYLQERFPLGSFSIYIASLVVAVYCVVSTPYLPEDVVPLPALLTMFLSGLGFFLLLRIADEFKDYEDDLRYRPYRPVPRGLVTLGELRRVGMSLILLLILLAGQNGGASLLSLALLLGYFALMCVEFFVPDWLKRHHLVYVFSHMVAMPLLLWHFATFLPLEVQRGDTTELMLLFGLAFSGGLLVEISRKLRAPQEEEEGVETYSVLWGPPRAALAFLVLAVAQTAFLGLLLLKPGGLALAVPFILCLVALCLAWNYGKKTSVASAKWIRLGGNILVLAGYFSLFGRC